VQALPGGARTGAYLSCKRREGKKVRKQRRRRSRSRSRRSRKKK
jgi:hypothetical protein